MKHQDRLDAIAKAFKKMAVDGFMKEAEAIEAIKELPRLNAVEAMQNFKAFCKD